MEYGAYGSGVISAFLPFAVAAIAPFSKSEPSWTKEKQFLISITNYCNLLNIRREPLKREHARLTVSGLNGDLLIPTPHRSVPGPYGKFRYEALDLKNCLVIFHDSTQRHTNPSVLYVHDLLKDT